MGYIAPVQQLTYQQYHQRVMKEKQRPFLVDRVYPIQNNMQYDSVKEEKLLVPENNFIYDKDNKLKNTGQQVIVNHTFMNDLDEKGLFLDTKI
ncbi:hypothetical protein GGQ92_001360 [Gracilibacillus halotolerans]|uniref:Uncharacterized protein n=1 Tax=Gracilibacillus halotolerans TaxID=74386 RepID=A0A841RNQ2_9BACI|nr:hypothetical protein [Gracilibacillus halotolerans]MBB6512574.1 hypothetical protein [Gracilibacillus halotolerans]